MEIFIGDLAFRAFDNGSGLTEVELGDESQVITLGELFKLRDGIDSLIRLHRDYWR